VPPVFGANACAPRPGFHAADVLGLRPQPSFHPQGRGAPAARARHARRPSPPGLGAPAPRPAPRAAPRRAAPLGRRGARVRHARPGAVDACHPRARRRSRQAGRRRWPRPHHRAGPLPGGGVRVPRRGGGSAHAARRGAGAAGDRRRPHRLPAGRRTAGPRARAHPPLRSRPRGPLCEPRDPGVARVPVLLRILRHHRGVRARAAGEVPGAGDRRAGRAPPPRSARAAVPRRRQLHREPARGGAAPAGARALAARARRAVRPVHGGEPRPRHAARAPRGDDRRRLLRRVRRDRDARSRRAPGSRQAPEPAHRSRRGGQAPHRRGARGVRRVHRRVRRRPHRHVRAAARVHPGPAHPARDGGDAHRAPGHRPVAAARARGTSAGGGHRGSVRPHQLRARHG
jgi:hypothetical protein